MFRENMKKNFSQNVIFDYISETLHEFNTSDVIIHCSDGTVPGNQLILAAMSDVFFSILKENFSTIDEKVAIILPDLKTVEVKTFFENLFSSQKIENYQHLNIFFGLQNLGTVHEKEEDIKFEFENIIDENTKVSTLDDDEFDVGDYDQDYEEFKTEDECAELKTLYTGGLVDNNQKSQQQIKLLDVQGLPKNANGFRTPHTCELCGFEPTTNNKSREKQDHLVMKHFKEQIEKILPHCRPFSCPNTECSFESKSSKQDLLRHYARNHVVLELYLKEALLAKGINYNLSDSARRKNMNNPNSKHKALMAQRSKISKDKNDECAELRTDNQKSQQQSYTCELCGFEPTTNNKSREKQDHLVMKHFKEQIVKILPHCRPFICPNTECSFRAKYKQDLLRHYTRNHVVLELYLKEALLVKGQEAKMGRRPISEDKFARFQCQICDYSTLRAWNLKIHMKKHEKVVDNEPKTCEMCGLLVENAKVLKTHLGRVHGQFKNEKKYLPDDCIKCKTCYNVVKKELIESHICPSKFKCKECGKKFFSTKDRNKHMREEQHGWSCEICGKICVSLAQLDKHREVHEEKKECPQCGVKVRNLQVHIDRIHTVDKRFKCPHCEKGFLYQEELNDHIDCIHLNARRYQCRYCDFKFNDPSNRHHHEKKRHGKTQEDNHPYSTDGRS